MTSEEEAKEKGVKHPPKVKCLGLSLLSPHHTRRMTDSLQVLFTDQHGHHVAHNPEALTNLDKSKE